MADPPQLQIGEDKAQSVKIWRKKFNAWCLLRKDWRDPSKPTTDTAHWNADKYSHEIAAFHLAMTF